MLGHQVQVAEEFCALTNSKGDLPQLPAQCGVRMCDLGESDFEGCEVTELDDGSRAAVGSDSDRRRALGHRVPELAPLVDYPVEVPVRAEELPPVRAPLQLLAGGEGADRAERRADVALRLLLADADQSNYGTIDPYLINQTSETDHRIFSEALCTVTRAPVALLELFIIRKIGKPEFAKIATEFVAQDTHNLTARMLRARLAAYGIAL